MHSFLNPAPLLQGGVLLFGIFVLAGAFFKKIRPDFLPKIVFGAAVIIMALGMMRSAKFTERAAINKDIIWEKINF